MLIKQLLDEDFVNYKKSAMVIGMPTCTFKCDKECGQSVCQNSILARANSISIDNDVLISRYINNPITHSIVFGGLEPFDSADELIKFITELRKYTDDDVVIYTGYYKNEIEHFINVLSKMPNIVIKFGRFIPNQEKHYDEVLGVYLASDNQYAERIS